MVHMMNLFKRWLDNEPPVPTAEEKKKAETFKQILKYGEDIGGMYKDVSIRLDAIFKEKRQIQAICEKSIIKQQRLKFKESTLSNNWNSIYIREYSDCKKSPIGTCVTMLEFGDNNPNINDTQHCFYCNKGFKK